MTDEEKKVPEFASAAADNEDAAAPVTAGETQSEAPAAADNEDNAAAVPVEEEESEAPKAEEVEREVEFGTELDGGYESGLDIEPAENIAAAARFGGEADDVTEGIVPATEQAAEQAEESGEPVKKDHMSQKLKSRISNGLIYTVLVIMSIVWVLPFIGIVFESFRVESTGQVGYIFPHEWGFDNYVRLFKETKFLKWFGNTLLMGIVTAIVQTVFVLAVSYALSRNRFKGRKFLMNLMLIFGMFPGFLTLILLYTWMSDWNLTGANAPYGLMILYVASSGMGYYIAKGFFDTISRSLDEAARVDGATRFQIFYKIIIPLSKPIVIYTILMGFMGPWGDFVMAAFMANNSADGYNVAAGLQWLLTDSMKNDYYTTFCAGGVVVAVPITVLFMCLQKYYVAGVTGGAVKG